MNYTSQIDHDLIKEHGFDKEKIREQLNEAEKLQFTTYKNHIAVNKTPIVITAVVDWISYGFYFDPNPVLGREEYNPGFPAYTSYVVAILWPETSNRED